MSKYNVHNNLACAYTQIKSVLLYPMCSFSDGDHFQHWLTFVSLYNSMQKLRKGNKC